MGVFFCSFEEQSNAGRESVREIPLEEISDFSNLLFKAKMDGSMADMVLPYKYISA